LCARLWRVEGTSEGQRGYILGSANHRPHDRVTGTVMQQRLRPEYGGDFEILGRQTTICFQQSPAFICTIGTETHMHAHFVLAHPEPKSFNAHLVQVGTEAFASNGWATSVSDLYAAGFDPCERPEHYANRLDAGRFDLQAEQRHASASSSLPRAVTDEIASIDRADVLVLQYPMWWHLPPAILKGWFDRVFAYGEVYASQRRFEKGRYAGKRAMLSITVGTSRETYCMMGAAAIST
jgi:putative NADPH-quinone reductase